MADPAVLTIKVDHPDRCHAADCTVPAHTDILLMVPTDAYSGRKFEKRVCLGHFIALRGLVDWLAARRVPIQMMTPGDIARAQAQPQVVFTMTNTFTMNSTSTGTRAFFYR